jgi:hypothetical protein
MARLDVMGWFVEYRRWRFYAQSFVKSGAEMVE